MDNKIRYSYRIPLEVAYTSLYVYYQKFDLGIDCLEVPNLRRAIKYALECISEEINKIDFYKLSIMPPSKFHAPEFLSFNNNYYYTGGVLDLKTSAELEDAINIILINFNKQHKIPSKTFAIKLLFRAAIAKIDKTLPYKDNIFLF